VRDFEGEMWRYFIYGKLREASEEA